MNKYKVKVSHVFSELVDVEANDVEEAKSKAEEALKVANREAQITYEASAPSENWAVITEEKYNEMVKDVEAKLAEQQEPSNIITP
jgi:hypothetical protein